MPALLKSTSMRAEALDRGGHGGAHRRVVADVGDAVRHSRPTAATSLASDSSSPVEPIG